jgi:hypothetical protein
MPPMLATSATSGTVLSSNFRNQSFTARSCERIVAAGAVDEGVLVHPADAGGIRPERGDGAGGSLPWTWFSDSTTRERAQYGSVLSSNRM